METQHPQSETYDRYKRVHTGVLDKLDQQLELSERLIRETRETLEETQKLLDRAQPLVGAPQDNKQDDS